MTGPSTGRRWLILAICCLSLLMVGMDVTIVNVALPAIRQDLGASVSGLQWVIDAYTVVLASLLILSGGAPSRPGWSCSASARCSVVSRPASAG